MDWCETSSSPSMRQLSSHDFKLGRAGSFPLPWGWPFALEREGLGLPAFEGFQQGVEGAGGGSGGGDVAGAVASGEFQVRSEPPAGSGGVVCGEGLDTEHDLDRVAGAEGGEGEHGAVHAAKPPSGGFVRVVKGQGAQKGANGFVHEAGIDRSILLEDCARVVD
jgi:hypothetical protein